MYTLGNCIDITRELLIRHLHHSLRPAASFKKLLDILACMRASVKRTCQRISTRKILNQYTTDTCKSVYMDYSCTSHKIQEM